MGKILNITVQKKINNYLYNAYYLCVILSYRNLYPWFYERYIQLYYNPSRLSRYGKEAWMDFFAGWDEENDVLAYNICDRSVFNNIDIIDFIERNINENNYIYTYIDEYYIKPALHADDKHFVHDIFVYGYDEKSKQLMVIGFDENNNFCNYELSYSTFEASFINGFKLTEDWDNYVSLVKCKYNEEDLYEFKLSGFLTGLYEYLYSVDSSKTNIVNRKNPVYHHYLSDRNIYGINVYDQLIKYLLDEDSIRSSSLRPGNIALDYRIFHTLYEHKVSICERLDYIIKNFDVSMKVTDLANDYVKIEQSYRRAKYLAMKYIFHQNVENMNEMISIVSAQKNTESGLLTEIYELLSRSSEGSGR